MLQRHRDHERPEGADGLARHLAEQAADLAHVVAWDDDGRDPFGRHHLNVAVSRARCLAVIVALPALGETTCEAIDDLPLLDFYARLTSQSSAFIIFD